MSTINERIAREVMGWPTIGAFTPLKPYIQHGGFIADGIAEAFDTGINSHQFQPDTNPADALAVLKVCAEKTGEMPRIKPTEYGWRFVANHVEHFYPTLEAAICAFALALLSPAAQAFNPDEK